MQIATRDGHGYEWVFLLDLQALLPDCTEAVDMMLTNVLRQRHILKIGQGLKQDFEQLHSAYPYSHCFCYLEGSCKQ